MSLMGYSANDPGPASAPGLQRTKYDEDAARVVPFVDPSDKFVLPRPYTSKPQPLPMCVCLAAGPPARLTHAHARASALGRRSKAIVSDAEPMLQPDADPRRFVVAKEDAFSIRGVQPPDVRAVDVRAARAHRSLSPVAHPATALAAAHRVARARPAAHAQGAARRSRVRGHESKGGRPREAAGRTAARA